MSDRDDRPVSRRQLARRARRTAGDRSARLANALMRLPATALAKLELEDELREVVDRARRITSHVARRRAERALAGELRRIDLGELEKRLTSIEESGVVDSRLFHQAEQWRARLIEEGLAAADTFPGGPADPLPLLVERARHERATGRPPGAARALFRHVLATLKAQQAAAARASDRDDDADDAHDADHDELGERDQPDENGEADENDDE